MSGSGREALPDVREWSGGTPGCPGIIDRPSRMSGSGRSPSRTSGSSRETLGDVWEWSGGPFGFPGLVGRPSRMSGSGREAVPDVQEWSRGPP